MTTLPWISPLAAAEALGKNEAYWVLLYSGQQLEHTGRYSFLALYPEQTISGNDFALFAPALSVDKPALANAWFGYFGYEMLHNVEELPRETKSAITLPDMWFTRFGLVIRFDHQTHMIDYHCEPHITLPAWPNTSVKEPILPEAQALSSSISKDKYLHIISQTKNAITRGDLYQANITRKFTGKFADTPDTFSVFRKLCEVSPAAYSAFIKIADASIATSSPERFLAIDTEGRMDCRPIKGTAPRFTDINKDESSRTGLEKSEKDRAENLMIVDLMRNDLSRSARPGSIEVKKLFEISSYATLHHMASTITGYKRPDMSALESVRLAFPPGSMTGAPKINAMKWCLEQERIRRGVYSGALGWFGGDGSCDLSVVIRTLIMKDNDFEFQVGGGIVADSDAEKEWQETMTKARGIMTALGLNIKTAEAI